MDILNICTRKEFRSWLSLNHDKEKECFVVLKRGRPKDDGLFYYLDAVEEALCFGWIDSTLKKVDGKMVQRFSPRTLSSNWTELNKERVRRLEKLGLMTDAGRNVLPPLNEEFVIDSEIESRLKKAQCWDIFITFPKLYQRVRLSNLSFYKKLDKAMYQKGLEHLIEETKKGHMFGEWNDYGRLLEY